MKHITFFDLLQNVLTQY